MWMDAEAVYIPTEQNSNEINLFRPFLPLDVEEKIFLPVMASRLINTLFQKRGIPAVFWEAIQRAKSEKLKYGVVLLDVANAYGSVSHNMESVSS